MTTDYPITIIKARYGGAYEGGQWIAFDKHPERVPRASYGSDNQCMDFFHNNQEKVGVGSSPEEAVEDLMKKQKEFDKKLKMYKDIMKFSNEHKDG